MRAFPLGTYVFHVLGYFLAGPGRHHQLLAGLLYMRSLLYNENVENACEKE